jgi:hypothetical protein
MTKPEKRPVPPMKPVDRNVADLPPAPATAGYNVYSWSPGKAGEGVPSTQVHLVLPIPDGSVTMRLKSARAVDEMIAVLLQHRNDVWPEPGGPMTPDRVELEAERTKIAEAVKLLPHAPLRALELLR